MSPAFESARLELARVHVDRRQDRERALEQTARVCAHALGVDRVGVWFFDGPTLWCEIVYERSNDRCARGERLEMGRYPAYATALRERRAIVAPDAPSDPVTRELVADYLGPYRVGALLDAPLYVHGEVVGVVCHEHVGGPRDWTQSDVDFASTVADMCSTILEQASRAEAEAELSERAWRSSELHRLELLAELAGAIAHDFNNVLASVGLVGESLSRHASPEIASTGRSLVQTVEIGARLVAHLRALREREPSADDRSTVVSAAVERLAHLLEPLMRANAVLRLAIEEHTARVTVSPTHLDQLLMNLCLNAREAIDAGGRVEVRVRPPTPEEGPRAEWVAIDVEDDGSGIAPEDVPRLFDPYFTTKPTGSGQGLATVQRIVRAVGGRIDLETELGRGTRFTLLLPRTPPSVEAARAG